MIYLPEAYLNKPCYIVNNGYIRVYDTIHTNYQNVVYDIYVNQNYQVKKSTASYNSSIQCDVLNTYTSDFYYRNDLADILIIFFIISIIIFYLPFKIVSRFCGRWLKI